MSWNQHSHFLGGIIEFNPETREYRWCKGARIVMGCKTLKGIQCAVRTSNSMMGGSA